MGIKPSIDIKEEGRKREKHELSILVGRHHPSYMSLTSLNLVFFYVSWQSYLLSDQ